MSSAADEKSSFNGDAAVDAVDSPAPIFEIDPAVERRVVRKLDCTVLIAFGLVFGESKRARLFFAPVIGRLSVIATGPDSSVATCSLHTDRPQLSRQGMNECGERRAYFIVLTGFLPLFLFPQIGLSYAGMLPCPQLSLRDSRPTHSLCFGTDSDFRHADGSQFHRPRLLVVRVRLL